MKIALIGTGVYSTALAYHLQKKDNDIWLWTENEKLVQKFYKKRKFDFLDKNLNYQKNVFLSSKMDEVLKDASLIFVLVGSKYFIPTLKNIKPFYNPKVPIFVGTKGMNFENIMFFSDIVRRYLKCNSYSYFAGPTFAKDLTLDETFALTVAGSNKIGYRVFETIWPMDTRLEFTRDLHGLELISVLKNVYAIGSGILRGLNVSDSTYYMCMSETVRETKYLIEKYDGSYETLFTYGGLGDYLMTIHSKNSRNFHFGEMIGSKKEENDINAYKEKTTIEGLEYLGHMDYFIKKSKLKDSILSKIYNIVIKNEDPSVLIQKK